MQSIVKFEHGVTLCAMEDAKLCRWATSRAFGMVISCFLFKEDLVCNAEGRLERCPSCLEAYPSQTLGQYLNAHSA